MRFLSLCSGIEAASVAWGPLGWKAVAFSEIDAFPSAVLAHHYPSVPNWGDMNRFQEWPDADVDVLCGGTPCQSFSVAGLRKGLDDPRGNLMLVFGAVAAKYRPRWLVWENVPGVLSSNGGRDFGAFLGMLGQLGYGFAYRVLDAQYFGVAQRRRRVFVVGCLGDWRAAAAVLFERHSLSGHPAPSREAGEGIAVCPTLRAGGNRTGGDRPPGTDVDTADSLQVVQTPVLAFDTTQITSAANYSNPQPGDPCHPLAAGAHAPAIAFHPTQDPISSTDGTTHAMGCGSSGGTATVAVAVALRGRKGGATAELGDEVQNCLRASSGGGDKPHVLAPAVRDISQTLTSNYGKQVDSSDTALGPNVVFPTMQVRRLTPTEAERLQGFPTVSEKVLIEACLDHQNQSVHVALKCLRWQNSAWPAGVSELMPHAKTAAVPFSTSQASPEPLAALHVRMHSVDELQEIRSAGRLIWSANGAGQSRQSLPPTLTENSVQELARLLREVARTITAGKVESPPSIRLSFPASSGAISAEKSGRETEASASDAMSDQHRAMFTTSDLGLITTFSDSTAETLCCFALHAIAGCIPSTTLPETFSIELTVETPYTAIPWRGKPADQCPDGPRYKAIGNSWAVPCARWIGGRIDAVDSILSETREAA